MLARLSSLPLFWQVFGANAAALLLAFVGLVFAPVTVSVPPHATELLVLGLGLLVTLTINLVLLRRAFQPLDDLADTMRRHDPLSPGERVRVEGGPIVAGLAGSFNEMLDRLEFEHRDSAGLALSVQEGVPRLITDKQQDEVGQTVADVMLQEKGLVGLIANEPRKQF